MHTADVNWLLSTAVQSGAALVAIIGGLLVSRLVTLDGERSAARRRVSDLKHELNFAAQTRDKAARQREQFEAGYFLIYAEDDIFERGGVVDEATLNRLIEESRWQVSEVDRHGMVAERIDAIRNAFTVIKEHLDGRSPRNVDEDEVLAALVGRADRDDILEAYRQIVRQTPIPRSRDPFGIQMPDVMAFMPPVNAATSAADRQTRDRRGDELEHTIETAKLGIERGQMQLDLAEQTLAMLASPPGVRPTLASLIFLSLACLVFPLTVMIGGPLTLALGVRVLIVGVFVIGLAVFFAELIRLLRTRADA